MQGDIWSGAFTFESPLKDLLDSGSYSLVELLEQDELLQELRGMHPTLVGFFSSESSVLELVHHVIGVANTSPNNNNQPFYSTSATPNNTSIGGSHIHFHQRIALPQQQQQQQQHSQENQQQQQQSQEQQDQTDLDYDLKTLRYPYMACEVLCSEINSIIDTLVDGQVVDTTYADDNVLDQPDDQHMHQEETILDVFFSLLYKTEPGQLDDYRAGYFDKILSVLCRKRPQALTTYINEGGPKGQLPLIKAMLKHLYSHSILQVVQRLLLPVPQQEQDENERFQNQDDEDDAVHLFRSRWSETPQGITLLLETLLNATQQTHRLKHDPESYLLKLNEAQNASEVLITVIQNSPLTSNTILTLTQDPILEQIMKHAVEWPQNQDFTPHDSALTCCMNVLESLVLQLGGYGGVATTFDESVFMTGAGPPPVATAQSIQKHLPMLLDRLVGLLRHPSTQGWTSRFQFHSNPDNKHDHENENQDKNKAQTKPSDPQLHRILGTSRLRMIRLIESLVLLGNPDVDQILCQSPCLEICLDLFWEFEWNSMLHQSVANLLVHVFEGANARAGLQQYFLNQSNLLARLIESFEEELEEERMEEEEEENRDEEEEKTAQNSEDLEVEILAQNMSEMNLVEETKEELKEEEEGENQDSSSTVAGINTGNNEEEDDDLPISDDDVDVALEQRLPEEGEVIGEASPLAEMIQKEQTQQQQQNHRGNLKSQTSSRSLDLSVLRDILHSSSADAPSHIPSLRKGYMGHVIIICQALVHACTNPGDQNDFDNTAEFSTSPMHPDLTDDESAILQQQQQQQIAQYQQQLVIANLIQEHPMNSRWQDFVATTLSSETAIQSTPLGGFNASAATIDPLHTARLGLTDLSDYNDEEYDDDDGEGEDEDAMPPDRESGLTIGGDVIDMDDTDLDIAASMMDAYGGSKGGTFSPEFSRNDYMFDDPLGGDTAGSPQFDGGDNNNASSDEDDAGMRRSSSGGDAGPPVMDLFAGNFAFSSSPTPAPATPEVSKENGWSNFANFDNAFTEASNTEDPFGSNDTFAFPPAAAPPSPAPVETKPMDDIFGSESHDLLLEDGEEDKKEAAAATFEQPGEAAADDYKDTGSEHSSDDEVESTPRPFESSPAAPSSDDMSSDEEDPRNDSLPDFPTVNASSDDGPPVREAAAAAN